MQTVTQKSAHYGWKSETGVDIGNDFEIRIVTMKRSNGSLTTNAQRVKVERGMISFMMFSDFSKTYATSTDRCTEKNVKSQHEAVLANIEQIKLDCAAFYANQKD